MSARTRISGITYTVLAAIFALGVVLQALWAGIAVMSDASYWTLHLNFVHGIELLPVLMIVTGLVGKGPRTTWLLPLVAFAFIALQYVTAAARPAMFAGIHAANALIIFMVAVQAVHSGMRWRNASPQPVPVDGRPVARAS